ncbi:MAG: hypothetical protein JWP88_48 [Flaviaesturariibacter sp.]|nr:hypothetical protein [Flaviaesturariibacter sp.]
MPFPHNLLPRVNILLLLYMRKNLFLCSICCLLSFYSFSQSEYPIFKDTATLQPQDSGKLSLSIDNLNYLRNYEWFGKIPLSYTLLGNLLTPQLKYQLNDKISFKGGIMLRREFGRPGYVTVEPVFTAKYQKKGLTFLMGTLEGGPNHRFIEPLYNIERFIQGHMARVGENEVQKASRSRNEQGLQLKLDNKRFWMDWFIDWRESIIVDDPFREQLNTGFSTRTILVNRPNFKIELPAQLTISHHGGQISSDTNSIESLMNTALGLSFQITNPGAFIKGISMDHYFAYYRNISGNKQQLYNRGTGWLSTLTLKSRLNIDLDLRYWRGHQFYSPLGMPLYNSISEKRIGYGEPERELFFATFIYNKQLFNNVAIDMRLEPYYDLGNRKLEYGYSVFLRFNKDFFLKRLR